MAQSRVIAGRRGARSIVASSVNRGDKWLAIRADFARKAALYSRALGKLDFRARFVVFPRGSRTHGQFSFFPT